MYTDSELVSMLTVNLENLITDFSADFHIPNAKVVRLCMEALEDHIAKDIVSKLTVPTLAAGQLFADYFQSPYTLADDLNTRKSVNPQSYVGKPFKVLREITSPEHDEECLPAWVIEFEDGTVIQAWPEEILKGAQWSANPARSIANKTEN